MTESAVFQELPSSWYELEHHPEQDRLWNSKARFRTCHSGRRSGKTELAIRFTVEQWMTFNAFPDGLFILAGPTRDMAKDIFWERLKALVPDWFTAKISESKLWIQGLNGARIQIVGLDRPQRAEGRAIDGCVIDEYGQCKEEAFTLSISPALDTKNREGWCWFIGKPVGRNHYWELCQFAADPANEDWDNFHWLSEDILSPKAIEAAKRRMSEAEYNQEYRGSFVDFTGRAYYPFLRETHCDTKLEYDEDLPLIFCFDFNVEPGVAVVCQEQRYNGKLPDIATDITAVIGEVYIPKSSNTPMVCRKLIRDWGWHEGPVYVYGDATGGARGTAQVHGSDWDLIAGLKQGVLKKHFGKRLKKRVPDGNPPERVRVNALNARLRTADNLIHLVVNSKKAPKLVRDLEGVTLVEGGSGEIDKDKKSPLTHNSDALGYYVWKKHPVYGAAMTASQI